MQKTNLATAANKTVTAAGTAEALVAATDYTFVKSVVIQALRTNTDLIAVGDLNVVEATDRGTILAALNTVTFENVYLKDIFVDVGTNGEGVSFTYQAYPGL
jgi:hypothetical protein